MQSDPETTDKVSSALAIQGDKSDYAIIRAAMEDFMKLYGLNIRHKKDYQLVKRILNDMQAHDKKWPAIDENRVLANDSDPSDGDNEKQDSSGSQFIERSPTYLSAMASDSSVAVSANTEITTAPATTIRRTGYRWYRDDDGVFVDYVAEQSPVEPVATSQDEEVVSRVAERADEEAGKREAKNEMEGGSRIAIDRKELPSAGFEAMSLTDGRDIRGSENFVVGDDEEAGVLHGEKDSGTNDGNDQSYEMWW
ncbi:hypothetical protein EYC84_002196 [Monilinia fructicola]|uniref:Uncharacterized protein n=1 Tax=Monilinia fructicola TaxID=38448 RepID=A0A5M9JN73_MONFR|nr:hypothetical protein EYC84_002196 [Monilinia fructicola]